MTPIFPGQTVRDPTAIRRRDLATLEARQKLPIRERPYFALLSYCRHVGYLKRKTGQFWIARFRTTKGNYRHHRLGPADEDWVENGVRGLSYEEAATAANQWFDVNAFRETASQARPLGVTRHLSISPFGDVFTIGHALSDYVAWKRLAAAPSHFETNLSLVNYHLVPRLAGLPVEQFNGDVLRQFIRDVLETPPKRGHQPVGPRRALESLDEEALRKRKKTVNTLIGILRLSLQLAWESGKLENERALRCLRRLPMVDRPRTLHLSRAECRRLLDHCREDTRNLVLGALYTGCRVTELVRMRCSHVGRDGYGVYVTPVKSYRPRFVFLPDEAMIWFLELIRGRHQNDYVFLRYDGKPWLDRSYRYSFRTAAVEAELPDDFAFHGLRHTYASQLIQAGATVFSVAEQLGHMDPATVLRTYGHMSPQIRESEVRQRFTTLSEENARLAAEQSDYLRAWRSSLHGSDWRTYAQISDLKVIRDVRTVPVSRKVT